MPGFQPGIFRESAEALALGEPFSLGCQLLPRISALNAAV